MVFNLLRALYKLSFKGSKNFEKKTEKDSPRIDLQLLPSHFQASSYSETDAYLEITFQFSALQFYMVEVIFLGYYFEFLKDIF